VGVWAGGRVKGLASNMKRSMCAVSTCPVAWFRNPRAPPSDSGFTGPATGACKSSYLTL